MGWSGAGGTGGQNTDNEAWEGVSAWVRPSWHLRFPPASGTVPWHRAGARSMRAVLTLGNSAAPSPRCLFSQVPGASATWSSTCSPDSASPRTPSAAWISQSPGLAHLGLALHRLAARLPPPPRMGGAPRQERTQPAHLALISSIHSDCGSLTFTLVSTGCGVLGGRGGQGGGAVLLDMAS